MFNQTVLYTTINLQSIREYVATGEPVLTQSNRMGYTVVRSKRKG